MISFDDICKDYGINPDQAEGVLVLKTGEIVELVDLPQKDELYYFDSETLQ